MSNERIDLTQFEKILNGPWSLVDGSEVLVCPTEECLGWCECGKGVPTKGPWIWQYLIGVDIGTGRDMNIASINQTMDEIMAWGEESNLHEQIANYHLPPKEEGMAYATAKAVQILPNLIAELKRCYEELDEANEVGEALWNVLENWDICMDDYSMHDLYNGLNEKYARNNEGRIILKELHSYTEEDGWQPKEQASK